MAARVQEWLVGVGVAVRVRSRLVGLGTASRVRFLIAAAPGSVAPCFSQARHGSQEGVYTAPSPAGSGQDSGGQNPTTAHPCKNPLARSWPSLRPSSAGTRSRTARSCWPSCWTDCTRCVLCRAVPRCGWHAVPRRAALRLVCCSSLCCRLVPWRSGTNATCALPGMWHRPPPCPCALALRCACTYPPLPAQHVRCRT